MKAVFVVDSTVAELLDFKVFSHLMIGHQILNKSPILEAEVPVPVQWEFFSSHFEDIEPLGHCLLACFGVSSGSTQTFFFEKLSLLK